MNPDIKDFLADVVTESRWASKFLGQLFSIPAGQWIVVSSLCSESRDALEKYQQLTSGLDVEIVAVWLPHPFEPTEAFLVNFYQDNEMSSSVAIVSKHYLDGLKNSD